MEPASIRYKNPGAMWGGNAISRKWGEIGNVKLNDGMGQNNHIAIFPSYVAGICAQIDLWRTPRYHNKKFRDAIAVWSGGNWVASYIKFVLDRVPGMTADQIMSDEFLKSQMGLKFLRAQAWHEAGKVYPATDAEFAEAQRRVFGGVKPTTTTAKKVIVATSTGGGSTVAAAKGFALSLPVSILIGLAIAGAIFAFWKWKQNKTPPVVAPPTPAPEEDVNHGGAKL